MKKNLFILISLTLVLSFSCQQKAEEVTEEKQTLKQIKSVCVWDKISVRKAPSRAKGTYASALSLGEIVTWDGQVAVDSTNNKEYLHIILSDSTEGWTQSFALVANARPAVVLKEVTIHERPDPLTRSNKSFKFMDVLVIRGEKGEWIEVIGDKTKGASFRKGWIKKSAVSRKTEDITSAVLALRILRGKDDVKEEDIKSIIETAPYPESIIIQSLKNK